MIRSLEVEGLSKEYRLGAVGHGSLRSDLESLWAKLRKRPDPNSPVLAGASQAQPNGRFLALRDVTFHVAPGEAIGIIGRNGAGKSTLLKILSRVTTPSSGRFRVRGKLASLLEVGTGFHPELTGRENIFLNGAILGMNRKQIASRLDDIIDFAGITKFVDTPVKRYSSGMYVRLAFAVAAHLDADVLLVDEVLAVGDAEFQKRCLQKMEETAYSSGRTVIFVSHNMDAIERLCKSTVVLDQGKVVFEGDTAAAVSGYLKSKSDSKACLREWPDSQRSPGNAVVRLKRAAVEDLRGMVRSEVDVTEPFTLRFDYEVLEGGHDLSLVVEVLDHKGNPILVSFDGYTRGPWGAQPPAEPGEYVARCAVPANLLNEGETFVSLRIFSPPAAPNEHPHVRILDLLAFDVVDNRNPEGARGSFPYSWGVPVVRPKLDWTVEWHSRH